MGGSGWCSGSCPSRAWGRLWSRGICHFSLMLLITLVWRDARHGRWTWAGALLGVGMSIKPFLLVFIPYLVLKRHWRGVVAAGLTAGFCFLLGLAVFGVENHRSWLQKLSTADSWAWLPMNASLYGIYAAASRTTLCSLAGGARSRHGTGDLALPGHTGRPGGVIGLAHRFFENRDRPGVRPSSWSVHCSCLPWDGPITSGCRWARSQRWRQVGGVDRPAPDRRRRGSNSASGQATVARCSRPRVCSSHHSLTLVGQPLPLATLFYGGISFWSLLLVWLALIVDGLDLRSIVAPAGSCSSVRARNREILEFVLEESHSNHEYPHLMVWHWTTSGSASCMPVFSETGTVCTIVEWLRANLGPRLFEVIIVISPRSSQASKDVCQGLARSDSSIHVLEQQENPGVGRAFREGYARVRGNVVLSMDSDGEMEIETIPRMIAEMATEQRRSRGRFPVAPRWGFRRL